MKLLSFSGKRGSFLEALGSKLLFGTTTMPWSGDRESTAVRIEKWIPEDIGDLASSTR